MGEEKETSKPERQGGGEELGAQQPKKRARRAKQTTVESIANAIMILTKVSAIVVVLIWVILEHEQVELWLRSLTHAELYGVKLDRDAIDRATSELLNLKKKDADFSLSSGEAALRRAVRVAPAIVGARILWVDDQPANNETERRFLANLKMDVKSVTSSADAFRELRRYPYDLIVSDIWRPADQQGPLEHCKVHYFAYPDDKTRREYEQLNRRGLSGFNEDANEQGAAGFTMAEALADRESEVIPPVIFYSAGQAKVVRSLCGRTTTNRRDVLLQAVVSAIEELRWAELPDVYNTHSKATSSEGAADH